MAEEKLYFLRDSEDDKQPSIVNGYMEFLATGTFEELEALGFKLVGDFGWYDHAFYDCQLHEATFESKVSNAD